MLGERRRWLDSLAALDVAKSVLRIRSELAGVRKASRRGSNVLLLAESHMRSRLGDMMWDGSGA